MPAFPETSPLVAGGFADVDPGDDVAVAGASPDWSPPPPQRFTKICLCKILLVFESSIKRYGDMMLADKAQICRMNE
jgi:hypothetical protein